MTLIERTQEAVDAEAAAAATDRLADGSFTLEDFLVQLREMRKLGPVQDLLGMLPGGAGRPRRVEGPRGRGRRRPAPAGGGHHLQHDPGGTARSRYDLRGPGACGSPGARGVTTADVNALLRDFEQARRAMRAMLGGAGFPGRPRPGPPEGEGTTAPLAQVEPRRYDGDGGSMATRIRLRRMGSNKRPAYRVVVADQRAPRDGRFIEVIGKYQPRSEPSVIEIDEERALHWLRVGAQPSDQVRTLLDKVGIWGAVRRRAAERRAAHARAAVRSRPSDARAASPAPSTEPEPEG
ncbi:MAG: hypothetical protein KatS3mg013_0214 [Actinomycetota bacterium]|nr:MAG: hypothetical protein KatS3mg013_0214 [Actinomycetota bacterium]